MFACLPLIPERWTDFEELFGPRGACAGCWCTYWKVTGKQFKLMSGESARQNQKSWVDHGLVPGLLAYDGDLAVGWMAIEPRSAYPRLASSRVLKPIDDQAVWSITCFYTRKPYRGKGVSVALLQAAIGYVASMGGKIVEGYPVDATAGRAPDVFVFTGLASAYLKAGYREVARNSEKRPIFRYLIEEKVT